MNTIPKIKINQINLNSSTDFQDIILNSNYNKLRFLWNSPNQLEIAGFDCAFSSEFSTIEEFYQLSRYYKSIINKNSQVLSNLSIPLIFIINSFDMEVDRQGPWSNIPKGFIFIPETMYINHHGNKKLLTINKNTPISKHNSKKKINRYIKPKLKSETSKNTFLSMVQESIELMKEKKISKIVLSRQKNFDFDFNIFQQLNFISKANNRFPDCVNFLYDFKDLGIFFGISPETLFKTNDDKFYSEALAGTFKSTESLNNIDTSKEFEEHKFVIDHIKESISAFSNNIQYSKEPYLMSLNSITHMKTEFKSHLKENVDPFDIIHKLHPTPAVCGNPTDIAMNNIRNIENHDRGWYSGNLGWIDSNYNSHFIVSIRSGLYTDKKLYLYAGCGITRKSDKNKEYDESEIKFNSILSILNNE